MTTTLMEPDQTMPDKTTAEDPRFLTPDEISWLAKTSATPRVGCKELAELSGLQTRTIQRVEQGQPSSTDTRRAIARAFKFDDIDYFNVLKDLPRGRGDTEAEAFDREHLLLDARVVDGRQLLAMMQDGPDFRTICPMSLAELPRVAQDAFAVIVDFVRDCIDVFDDAPQSEILGLWRRIG